MFQVRQFNVGDHAPLKARYEASLEPWDFRGWAIAGEDDLTSALIKRVERVEELFLHRLFALEEMHVVHKEEIGLAKSSPEVGGCPVLYGSDELVGELFCPDECDSGVRASLY